MQAWTRRGISAENSNGVRDKYTFAMVEDLYYKAMHYNLKYKTGALLNRITAHDVCGIRHQDIEWIWIVEEKRNATPEEIRELCRRASKASATSRTIDLSHE